MGSPKAVIAGSPLPLVALKLTKYHKGPSQGCWVTLGLKGWPGWPQGAPAPSVLPALAGSLPLGTAQGAEPREGVLRALSVGGGKQDMRGRCDALVQLRRKQA